MFIAYLKHLHQVVALASETSGLSLLIFLAVGAAIVVGVVWLFQSRSSSRLSNVSGVQSDAPSARAPRERRRHTIDLPPAFGVAFGQLLNLSGQHAVTAFRTALQRAQSDPTIIPVMRAGLHWGLADALVELDDSSTLDEALQEYGRAVEEVSPRMYPDIYAGIQRQFGITCIKASVGKFGRDLVQQGMQALHEALAYTQRKDDPEEWATINAALGTAYAQIWDAKQANAYWDAALSIFTERTHPSEHMRVERARKGLRESMVRREQHMIRMKQELSPQYYEIFRKIAEGRDDDL